MIKFQSCLSRIGRHLFDNREVIAFIVLFAASGLTASPGRAAEQGLPSGVVELAPGDIQWKPRGPVAGLEQAELVGAQDKAGPYVVRHKFPTGFKARPHTHTRHEDVHDHFRHLVHRLRRHLRCGEAEVPLPAGSFYTEPANTPHFVEVREAVVIQVMGNGPSGTKFTEAAAAAKH